MDGQGILILISEKGVRVDCLNILGAGGRTGMGSRLMTFRVDRQFLGSLM